MLSVITHAALMNTPQTLSSSQSLWRQLALGKPGLVTGADSVTQCVRIILRTPKGSDPLRPDFGNDAWRYLDSPVNKAVPYVIRESIDALRQWEPRCLNVQVKPLIHGEHVTLQVSWQLQNGHSMNTEVVWR